MQKRERKGLSNEWVSGISPEVSQEQPEHSPEIRGRKGGDFTPLGILETLLAFAL